MSDSSNANVHHDAHAGGGASPQRLIATILVCLVLPIAIIGSLVNYGTAEKKTMASEASIALATAQRIQKVGAIQLGEVSHEAKSGEEVFKGRCSACHGSGSLGAHKCGDASAWGPRIKTGFEALWNSALKGKGNMTPQGGGDLSDFEVARGVVYMANAGGAKFAEPKDPKAAEAKK